MEFHKKLLTSGKVLYTLGDMEVQWDPKREHLVIQTSSDAQSLFLLPEEVEGLREVLKDL